MKALITATGQIGPFASITRTTGDTGWLAGDCIYPDGVIGDATVGDSTPPAPTAEQTNAPILSTIATLEATVTPRRIREALTTAPGKTWLVAVDSQIAALRGSLVK